MKKVFFGGSRNIRHLNQAVRDRIDNVIKSGYRVLIGDANGADKAVQEYLAEKNYENVLVFCMENNCRNNLGNWNERNVSSNNAKKDFHYYSTKDVLMSREADYGFMLWDGKSKGTLNNILNLCEINKIALVYFSLTGSFHTVQNNEDISKLLEYCDSEALRKLDKTLELSRRIPSRQQELKFA